MYACDGDIINIDGTGTSRDPYPCQNEKGLDLAGLVLRSYNSRAFISCRTNGFRFFCGMASRGVILEEITFVNTSIHLFECSLNAVACSFINSSVPTLTLKYDEYLMMRNVQLNGCTFQNNSACSVTVYGNSSVDLNVSNSTFVSNKIRSEGDAILNISIQNLHANQSIIKANFIDLRVLQNICSGKACFRVFAGINGNDLVLVMERVLFKNNVAEVNILDVHGFSNGYTDFKSSQFRKNKGRAVQIHDGISVELKIERALFSENKGGAVEVSGFTKEVSVWLLSSNFISNKVEFGGACVFVGIPSLLMDVEDCQFVRNEGRYLAGAMTIGFIFARINSSPSISIKCSHFINNTLISTYTPSPVTEGGGALALFVSYMGNLSLINNTFAYNQGLQENTPTKIAGAIYARVRKLLGDVEIRNSEFLCNYGALTSILALYVENSQLSLQPRVTLQNLTFVNNSYNFNDSNGCSILISEGMGFKIMSSCKIHGNSGGIFYQCESDTLRCRGNVLVEDTMISGNIDFTLEVVTKSFHLKNVSFVNNSCIGPSEVSVLRVMSAVSNSSFHLDQSTFLNNFGEPGVVHIDLSLLEKKAADGQVIINDTEFRGNFGRSEGVLKLLKVNRIKIQNCKFINNFGGIGSSHANVQRCLGMLIIRNTSFNQFDESQVFESAGGLSKHVAPYLGFLTVTNSENVLMCIRNSSFASDPFSTDSIALIVVEEVRPGLLDSSVRIETPINTKLKLRNITEIYEPIIGNKQVTISTIFTTERCPEGTYSIHRGTRRRPSDKHVNCYPCPVGGNCSLPLAAQPNFWGYPENEDIVSFQLCPEGYCCLPSAHNKCFYDNNSYNLSGCQGNRTGILCGQCKQNFTEGLFTTECVRAKDCTHSWYLVVFFALTSLFALYLVRKPPVFEEVGKQLTWFIPRRKEGNNQVICSLDSTARKSVSPNYGFLKIIFYFYQVAGVLTVSSYGVKNILRNKIVLPVTNLFNLKLYANTNLRICPWPILTPLSKTMFHLVTVMTILFSIPIIYLLHSGLNKLRKRRPTLPPAGPYFGAVLEIVLLGYSAVTGTTVRLLHCVSIQEKSRWYYDAQHFCWHQWWQQAAIVVIALNLFPFILTLYFTSLQLYRGKISAKIFLLASILPFPYLLFVLYHHVKNKITRRPDYQAIPSTASSGHDEEHDSNSSTSIKHSLLEVLCGPFTKPQDDQSDGRIYWESILIGRRFLIIVIGWWQLDHALMRSVCLTILCLVFLLHHISQRPFVQCRANIIETVSLATLVVVGVLNVGLTRTGSDFSGMNQAYISILWTSEAVLLGVLPLAIALFLSLSLVSQILRLGILLIKAIRSRWSFVKQKYNHDNKVA